MKVEKRFWAKVKKTESCWLWTAAISNGYGCFWFRGRNQSAHRVAYLLCIGPIPMTMEVLHSCDIKRCVNPSHLFLGTQADNIKDMVSKGRHAKGEQNGRAKLNWQQVRRIRLLRNNYSLLELGEMYGVDPSIISDISRGKSWKE